MPIFDESSEEFVIPALTGNRDILVLSENGRYVFRIFHDRQDSSNRMKNGHNDI